MIEYYSLFFETRGVLFTWSSFFGVLLLFIWKSIGLADMIELKVKT